MKGNSTPKPPDQSSRARVGATMCALRLRQFDACFESRLLRIHNQDLRAEIKRRVQQIVNSYRDVPSTAHVSALINKLRKELASQYPEPVKESLGPRLVKRKIVAVRALKRENEAL